MEKVKKTEELLKASWSIVTQDTDTHHSYKCFGRLWSILFLVGKQKHSREARVFEELDAIVEVFTQEMSKTPMQQAQQQQEDQEPNDVLNASPKEMALLQNQHMKVGHLYLGLICFCVATWHYIQNQHT